MRRRDPPPPLSFREERVPCGPAVRDARPTFIDLFCGCGGFCLGMQRAGFRSLAAIDSNPEAVATLQANLPDVTHALERDLTVFPPEDLAALLGTHHVDVIVGGPPCQGFSKVRRVDGANNGARLVDDPRRHLFRDFLRYVDFFQPRVFVMENVLGLRTAVGGAYFTAVQKEARGLGRVQGRPGYRVHGQVEDAWELGVPQKRRRQLIIGVRGDLPGYFIPDLKPAPRALPNRSSRSQEAHSGPGSEPEPTSVPPVVLWDAIGDLPVLRAGSGDNECAYDVLRRADHVERQGIAALRYLLKVVEIDEATSLTNHVARPHSDRDLRDFALLREGESSAAAMRRGVRFEFPYDKSTFKDRYTRQSRTEPCSTIVAHLSKDGLMFIHPTQSRSLTPREAARVQTFPDWFRFPESRTQAYRLIGNAVPPLVAEAVGCAVKVFLGSAAAPAALSRALAGPTRECMNVVPGMSGGAPDSTPAGGRVPQTRAAAARELERLARLDRRALRALPNEEFLRGWHALLFLFPGLHPDNALDHGDAIEDVPIEQLDLPGFEQLLTRRHVRSGWPVALELIGREAWRRYEAGQLKDEDFYCGEAVVAGICYRNPELTGEVRRERVASPA